MLLADARAQIAHYCSRITSDGLVVGTAGNISIRDGDHVAITPSGLPYELTTPELVCVVSYADGRQVDGDLQPASELALHLAALRTTGLGAIVHTHSNAATAVASLDGVTELPPFHYYVAMFGGPIPVTEYATYGTELLAARVSAALADRTGCLLGQHGAVAAGTDLDQAYDKALILEWLADVWLRVRSVGTPKLLPAEEIALVASKVQGYGQRPPNR